MKESNISNAISREPVRTYLENGIEIKVYESVKSVASGTVSSSSEVMNYIHNNESKVDKYMRVSNSNYYSLKEKDRVKRSCAQTDKAYKYALIAISSGSCTIKQIKFLKELVKCYDDNGYIAFEHRNKLFNLCSEISRIIKIKKLLDG